MRRVYLRPWPDKTSVLGFLSNFCSGGLVIMRVGAAVCADEHDDGCATITDLAARAR
jgi:hypothetical protein